MKLFQKQKLKNLVKIDNNFMFYNVGAMYRLGLRNTELSIYNNFKNENEC